MDERPQIIRPGKAPKEFTPAIALEMAKAIRQGVDPGAQLDLVAYLLSAAVGDESRRYSWPQLRQRLNHVLGGAIAAGLDAGVGAVGHGCIVDVRGPMDRGAV